MQISKLMPIGVFAVSMAGGILIFYVSSHLTKEMKKIHIEQMIAEIINFIIFIWIGKIIMNLSLFIQDPLAILAYPSDSKALYVAVLCSIILLFFKSRKGKINVVPLLRSFLPVFLTGSFLYEFISLVWTNKGAPIGYFVLITFLLVLFILLQDRLATNVLFLTILVGWCFGILLLDFIQPFVTVFGFMVAPWFIWLFFTVHTLLIFRKRDINGWD